MKLATKIMVRNFWSKNWYFILSIIFGVVVLSFCICSTLNSYFYIETLEYANVDFEWVDDFQNYEICIVHEDKPHYLTVKDNKVKFIYVNEDFLNFVVVNHSKRIKDKKDLYEIRSFYINLNYKENEDDN